MKNENIEESPVEFVGRFFEFFKQTELPLMSEAKKFVTKTQQYESQFIGKPSVEPHLNNFFYFVKGLKSYTLREKYTTTPCLKTIIIKYEFECEGSLYNKEASITVIKEIATRKPSINGIWGININSFKTI